jgi:hypothetical protein
MTDIQEVIQDLATTHGDVGSAVEAALETALDTDVDLLDVGYSAEAHDAVRVVVALPAVESDAELALTGVGVDAEATLTIWVPRDNLEDIDA